ncbi:MAG: DUF4065 domain-containing protein [Armatimonadetes bacterium]|nr:DUF4065 domain-containing protein [Armatimonadota bacterium]
MAKIEYKKPKFKELLVYVCEKMYDRPTFGDVVLNKVLAEIEWRAYETLQSPVSGQTFKRNEHGPTSYMLLPVRKEMEGTDLRTGPRDFHEYSQRATKALRPADTALFSEEEMAVIDSVIDEYSNLNGLEAETKIKAERKGFFLWEIGDEIPYAAVFLAGREPTQAEKDFALTL